MQPFQYFASIALVACRQDNNEQDAQDGAAYYAQCDADFHERIHNTTYFSL